MDIKVKQWSSNLADNTTNVVVSVSNEITDGIKEKKEYEFTIPGVYDNLNSTFMKYVYNVLSKVMTDRQKDIK